MAPLLTRNSDDGVIDLLPEVGLSSLLHLSKDHGTDFLRAEHLGLSILDLDLDVRLSLPVDNLLAHKYIATWSSILLVPLLHRWGLI